MKSSYLEKDVGCSSNGCDAPAEATFDLQTFEGLWWGWDYIGQHG